MAQKSQRIRRETNTIVFVPSRGFQGTRYRRKAYVQELTNRREINDDAFNKTFILRGSAIQQFALQTQATFQKTAEISGAFFHASFLK